VEVTANCVRRSGSAVPGEAVTITVAVEASRVQVEVTDRAADGVPVLHPAGGEAEGGRAAPVEQRRPLAPGLHAPGATTSEPPEDRAHSLCQRETCVNSERRFAGGELAIVRSR
jgi:hypothetical protein